MKALVLTAPGKTEIRDIEKPIPADDEVLLKIGAVGFCGGDLNGFLGLFELQEYPNVLGHEVGAVIESTGKNVPAEFQAGIKVTLNPYLNCGKCIACRKGKPNACIDNKTMGVRRPGAMTEHITVDWRKLHASDKLSLQELALAEPLTVGFHAVDRGGVTAKDKVLVIGCGIVGLGAIAGALHRGAEVYALDVSDYKTGIAKKVGVKAAINGATQDVAAAIADLTGGDGPDVVIEAVGSYDTYKLAVELVSYTGRVVYIGYSKKPVDYNTGTFVRKEIEIFGSRNCLGDFPEVIRYLESGKFPAEAVISKTVSLQDSGDALKGWAENRGNITKIMVDLSI
ncbi:sorbitol dehydrogenase [Terrimonas sp.]|uniref:zinc-binding alcohol dehydrogenase family protein n=1 Tax=Terrimonas sp. TaxID=1914338 RepID=UPI000D505E91|nr:zinc-binding alcohol dehydrogenase family protein [Terrimonas sp.]PVD52952.1 sorbitol dehydrogenase [Terrimonas sp.]